MSENEIAVVVKFFAKPGVAALKITGGTIKTGDRLRYKGHTTDFIEEVASMEVNNQPVAEANVGDLIGVKVNERVRENDKVFIVVD